MRWNKGNSHFYTVTIPGEIPVKATISLHSESIVSEISIGGCCMKKWSSPRAYGLDEAKRQVEGILNELALGIWEG